MPVWTTSRRDGCSTGGGGTLSFGPRLKGVRRLWLMVGLIACVASFDAAVAAASDPIIGAWLPVDVDDAARGLLGDGSRYVQTRGDDGSVRVIDTVTGKRRRLAVPPCDNGASQARALGDGVLVWECASLVALGGHVLVVDDLATGRRILPGGLRAFKALERQSHDGSLFHVRSVGRHWIYLTRSGYHYSDDVLVAIDHDEIIYQPASRADVAIDPARASGKRRLCRGLRRSAGEMELGQLPFAVLTFHRPYAVSAGRIRSCAGAPTPPSNPLASALSDRWLTWASDRRLHLRSTASRATRATASRAAPARIRGIVLTDHFVYITSGRHPKARVFRARIHRASL